MSDNEIFIKYGKAISDDFDCQLEKKSHRVLVATGKERTETRKVAQRDIHGEKQHATYGLTRTNNID